MRTYRVLQHLKRIAGLAAPASERPVLSASGQKGAGAWLRAFNTSSSRTRPGVLQAAVRAQHSLPGAWMTQGTRWASNLAAAAESSEDEDVGHQQQQQHPQHLQQPLSPQEWRQQYGMTISDPDAPAPYQTFQDATLPAPLLRAFTTAGYTAPTFIQAQSWPIALSGRDLVAIASTGSGKTCGFLIPAFLRILERHALERSLAEAKEKAFHKGGKGGGHKRHLSSHRPRRATSCLVLAPTRELAQQIQKEADKFGGPLGITNAVVYGGASRGPQAGQLRRVPDIVIATPGRLNDFIQNGEADLSKVSYLVLDEADRMLDMGFEPQIRDIVAAIPAYTKGAASSSSSASSGRGWSSQEVQEDAGEGDGEEVAVQLSPEEARLKALAQLQTLFFSATWPQEVKAIARRFCRNDPVHLYVGSVQEKLVANKDITQHVQMVRGHADKTAVLLEFLQERMGQQGGAARGSSSGGSGGAGGLRAVVFCNTKSGCETLSEVLYEEGIKSVSVHGDKSQDARDRALTSFRGGRVPVLVATDVAARGLDVRGVTAVVNFDFPGEMEMYIHRIGRTGRAGASGESLTFITPVELQRHAGGLVQILRDAAQPVPEELAAAAARSRFGGQQRSNMRFGGGGRGGGRGGGGPRRHHHGDNFHRGSNSYGGRGHQGGYASSGSNRGSDRSSNGGWGSDRSSSWGSSSSGGGSGGRSSGSSSSGRGSRGQGAFFSDDEDSYGTGAGRSSSWDRRGRS